MKRSEMIQKLIEQFRDSAYLHIGEEEANAILMCIEENGMEPPKIKKTIILEKRVDPNRIHSYDQYLNEWDSENN